MRSIDGLMILRRKPVAMLHSVARKAHGLDIAEPSLGRKTRGIEAVVLLTVRVQQQVEQLHCDVVIDGGRDAFLDDEGPRPRSSARAPAGPAPCRLGESEASAPGLRR